LPQQAQSCELKPHTDVKIALYTERFGGYILEPYGDPDMCTRDYYAWTYFFKEEVVIALCDNAFTLDLFATVAEALDDIVTKTVGSFLDETLPSCLTLYHELIHALLPLDQVIDFACALFPSLIDLHITDSSNRWPSQLFNPGG
jgi:hypothetical protein